MHISYNYLNLPDTLTFKSPTDRIIFAYTATGQKLMKPVRQNNQTTVTLYDKGFIYEQGELRYIPQPKSYIEVAHQGKDADFQYVYQYTDQLGNVRLSYADSDANGSIDTAAELRDENNYYPFGLRHEGYNNVVVGGAYPFRYNGKELNQALGLNWYAYGARFYDAAIGRWAVVDPLAGKYFGWRPYGYVMDDPVNLVDPNGMTSSSTGVTENDDGTFTVVSANPNDGDRGVYIADEDGNYDTQTSEKVGNSVTTHSFVDDNGCAVIGAIIDPNSTEGQDFVDAVMKDNPSLPIYMLKALSHGDYDFKNSGDRPKGLSIEQYQYRGSVDSNGDFGSARDFGNITAGMVAARHGLSWGEAR